PQHREEEQRQGGPQEPELAPERRREGPREEGRNPGRPRRPLAGEPARSRQGERLQAAGGGGAGKPGGGEGVVVQHLAIAQGHLLQPVVAHLPEAGPRGGELPFESIPERPPQTDEARVIHQPSTRKAWRTASTGSLGVSTPARSSGASRRMRSRMRSAISQAATVSSSPPARARKAPPRVPPGPRRGGGRPWPGPASRAPHPAAPRPRTGAASGGRSWTTSVPASRSP